MAKCLNSKLTYGWNFMLYVTMAKPAATPCMVTLFAPHPSLYIMYIYNTEIYFLVVWRKSFHNGPHPVTSTIFSFYTRKETLAFPRLSWQILLSVNHNQCMRSAWQHTCLGMHAKFSQACPEMSTDSAHRISVMGDHSRAAYYTDTGS